MPSKPALVLPGGGARGAYQVGVLQALAETLPPGTLPFPVVAGTSAGSINAAVLASHADDFRRGTGRLAKFWSRLHCADIYRTGWWHNLTTGAHWLAAMTLGGLGVANPRSLLDNAPLGELLQRELRTDGIARSLERGDLDALLITASGYSTARAVTFFQDRDGHPGWQAPKRIGRPATITPDHLLASAALPLLFPARRIGHEFYGDGGMRQTTPLSPPIRMGADRLLIITTRDARPDPEPETHQPYPSLGDIGGYLLDVIFMDYLANDLARLERINHTLENMSPDRVAATGLRRIRALQIQPSTDLRAIANRHLHRIPASVRTLMRGIGAFGPGRLPSYLLFEAEFLQELMALGRTDGREAAPAVHALLEPE